MSTDQSSAQHTPGPWHISGYHPDPGESHTVHAKDGAPICRLGGHVTRHHDTIGNARLIAVAPELLAMVEQYASECGECNGTGREVTVLENGEFGPDADCECCADIRNLLARCRA